MTDDLLKAAVRGGTAEGIKLLVLFDIDGTLSTGSKFTESIYAGLKKVFEADLGIRLRVDLDELQRRAKRGSTLRVRLGELAKEHGIEPTPDLIERIIGSSASHFKKVLADKPDSIRLLAGAHELLEELCATDGIAIGVVTNNVSTAMELKLGHVGLFRLLFRYGQVTNGDEGVSKSNLLKIAHEKGKVRFGSSIRVVYVGDQVSDVKGGLENGMFTVAVATGRNTIEELGEAGASVVLNDLEDTRKVIEIFRELAQADAARSVGVSAQRPKKVRH